MAEYVVQINVKVGDHLININGSTPEEAFNNLTALVDHTEAIHAALSALDGGRPATEIVQKEKTWGARSQGGRSYSKSNSGSGQNFSQNKSSGPDTPTGTNCSVHPSVGLKRVEGGTNKAGRDYSPSIRCDGPPSHVVEWLPKDG